ncbi:acyl-CoA dehydrogenase family protein [Pseudomonas sp. NPDC087358]|uniref:acyl-CoA dehydrogenase family protein n=1 Tax=Pseudomonas sp. NPDC087358 TaxID=3364439 RepID=UPI00384AA889
MRELFEATIERLLADESSSAAVLASEGGIWPAALWDAVDASGFSLAGAPEASGGAEAGWADLYVIARAVGRFAAPVPLSEALLANWLLGQAGSEARSGSLSIAAESDLTVLDGAVSGVLRDVPWGRHVQAVLAIANAASGEPLLVVLSGSSAVRIDPRLNVAGEPRDEMFFAQATVLHSVPLPPHLPADVLRLGGALIRCGQIAGALGTLLEMTAEYAGQRQQFGKPIGSFQAIQQQLAVFAEQAGAANSAAEAAFAQSDQVLAWLPIAVAKVTCAEAATQCANIAHAVHGAIGFTQEYRLHLFSRRLWAWRAEYGSATRWSQQIGERVCAVGGDGLWSLLTQDCHSGVPA